VESIFSLRRKSAEAEFSSLFIPILTGGEFREGGLREIFATKMGKLQNLILFIGFFNRYNQKPCFKDRT
jgi:peptidoglycan biosynthesis protein MviN/MurJ (putative lipid II flippase)